MILPFLQQLLGLGLLLLLIMALLAPLESLSWWAGWFGPPNNRATSQEEAISSTGAPSQSADHYIVYLSGIGAIAGDFLEDEEVAFLNKLEQSIPNSIVVCDVFPYGMNNNGLTGQRFFASLWRGIKHLKLEKRELLTVFVNIRNVFQVAVSADTRYGPVYNYGIAQAIMNSLASKGYTIGSGKPITIIGFSGGTQVALGSATFIQPRFGAPIQIISLGGVMADDPGLATIEHLYHFHGSKDPIQKIGAIAYAGRWPLLRYSAWNRAKALGKISYFPAGPVTHNDPGGYLLASQSQAANPPTPQDRIVERIITLIEEQER